MKPDAPNGDRVPAKRRNQDEARTAEALYGSQRRIRDRHSYSLDVSDMYDAWGRRPLEHAGIIRYFGGKCFDNKNCLLRGLFSDAAGSFVAEWQIVDGLPIRSVLSSSQDIVHLFMEHIDPPEFD